MAEEYQIGEQLGSPVELLALRARIARMVIDKQIEPGYDSGPPESGEGELKAYHPETPPLIGNTALQLVENADDGPEEDPEEEHDEETTEELVAA